MNILLLFILGPANLWTFFYFLTGDGAGLLPQPVSFIFLVLALVFPVTAVEIATSEAVEDDDWLAARMKRGVGRLRRRGRYRDAWYNR